MSQIAELSTGVVFSLFYAITFGGILNRLTVWSAFWKSWPHESRRWWGRFGLSLLAFTVVPAVYFGVVLHYFGATAAPAGAWPKVVWAVGIFLSVHFLVACYRLWVAAVILFRVRPSSTGNAALERLLAFPYSNYLLGAFVSFILAAAGVGILWRLKPLLRCPGC